MLLAIASKLLHQILDKLVDGSTTNSTTEAVARRCSVKKGVLRNFAKFTGKHLFQGLFFKLGADIVNINDKLKENVKDRRIKSKYPDVTRH